MNYRQEYQNNKIAYLSLKYHYHNINLNIQIGGKLFQKKQMLYIVATISQRKLKHMSKQITDKLLGTNVKPYRVPHITLFNLIINPENPNCIIFQNKNFYNKIKDIYADIIANKNDPLILQSIKGPRAYSFPGFKPKYFLKNYRAQDKQKIIDFRNAIFDLIESILGKLKITKYTANRGATYHMYSFKGQKLFAESTYYDIWKPHLDFLNDFDITKHNPSLQNKLNKYHSNTEKINILLNTIKNIPLEIFDSINMATQMRHLTVAIDHIMTKNFKI